MSEFEKFKQSVMEEFTGKLTEAKKESPEEKSETKAEEESEESNKLKQDTDD